MTPLAADAIGAVQLPSHRQGTMAVKPGPGLGARFVERFESRSRVTIPVRVFVGRRSGEAQLLNISSRGLQLETRLTLRVGDIVDVRRGAQSLVGEVRWVRSHLAGVRLRQRIMIQSFLRGESDFILVPWNARATSGPRRRGFGGLANWIFAHFQWVILLAMMVGGAVGLWSLLARALAPLASIQLPH